VATNLARCKYLQAWHVVEGVVGLPLAGFGEGHVRVEDAVNLTALDDGGWKWVGGVEWDCPVPILGAVITHEDSKLALVEVSKQNFLV